jgi:hypothetical protein
MAASEGGSEAPTGDRGLIEDAVKLLISEAPAGWTVLRCEFEPTSPVPTAKAAALTPSGQWQSLTVSAGALSLLTEHQHQAAAAGASWQRLVIEHHCDGRLSAWTEDGPAAADPQRWPRRVLAAITTGCLIAAAVIFAVGWQWSQPPRVGMIPVPPPPPRQQEAFDVISRWFDAENHSNVAGMRAVACANPGPTVVGWFKSIGYYGEIQAYIFPEAVTSFSETAGQWKVDVAVRMHPLDAHMVHEVEIAEANGGFETERFTLVDEGGHLKVCDKNDQSDG